MFLQLCFLLLMYHMRYETSNNYPKYIYTGIAYEYKNYKSKVEGLENKYS